ncbi:MAG: hypothetical protein AAB538_01075, partial [Patescibacteria group bacterium]
VSYVGLIGYQNPNQPQLPQKLQRLSNARQQPELGISVGRRISLRLTAAAGKPAASVNWLVDHTIAINETGASHP